MNISPNCSLIAGAGSLPDIEERLHRLRPSRELLEFYRKKISEYDTDYESLEQRLEQYRASFDSQQREEIEVKRREEEIAELQKALSDVQLYLFQEREHVLRLYAENDHLKIKELEDRKTIHHLLSLGPLDQSETTYFVKGSHSKHLVAVVPHYKVGDGDVIPDGKTTHAKSRSFVREESDKSTGKSEIAAKPSQIEKENESLKLSYESLEVQLSEQSKLAKEQMELLLEDRRVKEDEFDLRIERDMEKLDRSQERLKRTQDLLYQSTKDFLKLKYETRVKERAWVEDRASLLKRMDQLTSKLDDITGEDELLGHKHLDVSIERPSPVSTEFLRQQLEQSQLLAENYREQCIRGEEQLGKLKEESEIGKHLYQERIDKLSRRLQLLNQRYEALEQRRNLEVEGYKNDIKMLRGKMKDLERQLYKVTLSLCGDQDMAILGNVRKTAGRSKELVDDLHDMKTKVYQLEDQFRHVHDR
ncbi:Coiled-coil domain-containing protein 77-like [Oopsacas minuta]|uniref:Coiled-coil domain-containing protein 77-like n=1 Tax=Oopsacas minuta TaxID=111878 RepID=A0AAV7JAY8_9METZ|nr:Coiled-coil domain-containing protein 77-like [Oopsacas minuta]